MSSDGHNEVAVRRLIAALHEYILNVQAHSTPDSGLHATLQLNKQLNEVSLLCSPLLIVELELYENFERCANLNVTWAALLHNIDDII